MKTTQRIFWGLVLIGAALFLILSQMGLITATVGIGTIIMGIICLSILVSGIANRSFGGIFFSLGLGWLIFGEMLGLPEVSWTTVLLIVILLSVGFHILFPNKSHRQHKHNGDKWGAYENEEEVGECQRVSDEENEGYVYSSNQFGATAKYINAQDFKGAELKNSFGEMKVYFDQAVIISSPVTLHVQNSFGEMQLFIPREWNVQHAVNLFAADMKENNKPVGTDGPIVRIEGNVSFGEITVTYV